MKLAGLVFFLIPLNIFGQNLTGIWIGRETGSSYMKLVVVQVGDSCFGYTYDEGPGFCKANFAGRFDAEKQKLRGKGVSFIARSSGHILAVYNLNYSKEGEDEYLDGDVSAKGVGSIIFASDFARLQKITTRVDTTHYMRDKVFTLQKRNKLTDSLQSMAVQKIELPAEQEKKSVTRINKAPDTIAQVKQTRVSKTIQHIITSADTIKMMLYDNGVVDDDTVTVFFDNAIILDSYRITEKAKELSVILTKDGREHTLELFANNLGKIPPNSALIIVMAGKERYEVYASYDLSTNAQIILQYKE